MNLRTSIASFTVLVLSLAAAESFLRLLMEPSTQCYAMLLGHDLPPCDLPSPYAEPEMIPREQAVDGIFVDGRVITAGDLWGIARYEPVIGYVPQENARSVNDWWITDHLGARVGRTVSRRSTAAVNHILIFGDSFAAGSRVPYEETWSSQIEEESSDIDVTNFAMDGFSMAQSYLRYLSVNEEIEHDTVLLMFVPEADLWRDLNVRRDIGGGWPIYWVMPRFVLVDGQLRLIESPFAERQSRQNVNQIDSDRLLREHLIKFDRFYVDWKYQPPVLWGRLGFVKAVGAAYLDIRAEQLRHGLMRPDSEALSVSVAIFRAMAKDVMSDGNRFILAILPTMNELVNKASLEYWTRWQNMIDTVCGSDLSCIDLSVGLRELPTNAIDTGYDGTHFGPNINRRIGRLLLDYLTKAEHEGE